VGNLAGLMQQIRIAGVDLARRQQRAQPAVSLAVPADTEVHTVAKALQRSVPVRFVPDLAPGGVTVVAGAVAGAGVATQAYAQGRLCHLLGERDVAVAADLEVVSQFNDRGGATAGEFGKGR